MALTVLALLGLALLALKVAGVDVAAAASGPAAPAAPIGSGKFKTTMRQLLKRIDTRGMAHEPIVSLFALETGYGSGAAFRKTNNLGSIHAVGAPNKYWNGERLTTSGGEVLRVYKSLDFAALDFIRLIAEAPRYAAAFAQLRAGNADAFYAEVASAGYAADGRYLEKLRSVSGRDG